MISCTEFIPLYSEFFKYLEKKGGHDAVVKYWYYISDYSIGDRSNPHSLASFIDKCGPFEGAIAYWNHTLTEEACDLVKVIDYNHRCVYTHMRNCPSRGMLNALEHVEPYYDYCGHCKVIYSRVLEPKGIIFEMDHSGIANAECTSIMYEKGNEPKFDYTAIDDSKVVIDMKTEDNKYLHRDFHLLGDLALKYCGEQFGAEGVIEFLSDYVKGYYSPVIAKVKANGLPALKEWIEHIYEIEEASDLINTELTDNILRVKISKSPVIEYMHTLNQEPMEYYIEETRTLYSVIASECGFAFDLKYYNDNGSTEFEFKEVD